MSPRVALLDRLDALYDDDLATLHRLFEELQLATVEAAQADDFTTFVCSARYFAAIQDTSRSLPIPLDLPANPSKGFTPVSSFMRPWNVEPTSTDDAPMSPAFPITENTTLDKNALPCGVNLPLPSSHGKQDEDDAESFSKLDTPVAKSEYRQNPDNNAEMAKKRKPSSEDEEMNEGLVNEDVKPPVRKAVKVGTSAKFDFNFNFPKPNTAEHDYTAGNTSLGTTRMHDEDENGLPSFDEDAYASWQKEQVEYGPPRFLFGVQDATQPGNGQDRLAGTHDHLDSSGIKQNWDGFVKRDTSLNRDHMPTATVPTANVPNYFSTSYKRFPICGFVYLLPTHHSPFLSGVGELSIGIIITEDEREKGLAKDALDQVLQIAFDKIQCQRVQAQIIDGPMKGSVLKLFTKLRFGHEGTRRRSFFSPFMQEWKDTTCLAMLATDWVIRCSLQPAPPSLWDEMFLRHDRERDALLRWDQGVIDEQRRLLHRTTSMETIRDLRGYQCESQEEDSDAQSVLSMAKGKEKGLAAADNQSAVFVDEASDPEYQLMESDDEGWSSDASGGANSPPLSVSSSSSSGGSFASEDVSDVLDHFTPRSDGYVSSSDGSQWDMLETSSNSSFDSLSESDYRGR